MKNKMFVLAVIVALSSLSYLNAQEHHHTKTDSTKTEMHHHDMKSDDSMNSDSLQTNTPWNAVCPVMGEEVDPEVGTVMYEGKAYGFCCKGCDKKFKKDPAKYSKNLSDDGKTFLKSE